MTLLPRAELGNRPDLLTAEIPAVGTTTARALTSFYEALRTGRILEPDAFRVAVSPAFSGTDAVFGNPATWGLGYTLGLPFPGDGPPVLSIFGMGGAGGAHAWTDTATGVTFALTKNRMDLMSDVGVDIIRLVRDETAG